MEQEGVAAGIEAIGKAKAEKTKAIGEATAEAYNKQVASLGKQSLATIEVMKQVSSGQIKITPDILVNSSEANEGAASNVLTAFLANMLKTPKPKAASVLSKTVEEEA